MKKFLNKFLIFNIIIFIMFFSTLLFLHYKAFDEKKIKIEKYKTILIFGDSQTECGINDEIFRRALNLSQSAENNLFIFNKIRSFVSNNNHVDTVILNYSISSIMSRYDMFYNQKKYLDYKLPKYFKILDYNSIVDLIMINKLNSFIYLPNIIKHNFSIFINQNNSLEELEFGSFLKLESSFFKKNKEKKLAENLILKNENDLKRLDKYNCIEQIILSSNKLNLSKYQIIYLQKINNFCKKNNIKLILVATPVYKVNSIYTKEIIDLYLKLPKFLNLEDDFKNYLNLFDSRSYFYDGVHLNLDGANTFTNQLIDDFNS